MKTETGTESVHKIQNRALRIISDNKFNALTEHICRAEGFLNVMEIYRLGIYKFRYKPIITLNNPPETIMRWPSHNLCKIL